MKKFFIIASIWLGLFQGCAVKYLHHQARVIVFKTPKAAFADAGFIHDDGSNVKVEIFEGGHPVLDLEIGRKICKGNVCVNKSDFVHRELSPYYEADILQQLFLGKPIFSAKGIERNSLGFSQKLFKAKAYDISYNVSRDAIRFKDKIAKILIKIKKIQE